jgi:iron(III) transport system substrate-binding protein
MITFSIPNVFAAAALVGGTVLFQAHAQPVVYTSTDQEYAEVVLKEAEAAIGQKVTAVFDAEASKTVGLERRLAAEKSKPKADIFWNSEFLRTHRLDKQGLLAATALDKGFNLPASVVTPHSVGFGIRGRVLAVHTPSVPEADRPKRIEDLADPRWKGKVAIGQPLFGAQSQRRDDPARQR